MDATTIAASPAFAPIACAVAILAVLVASTLTIVIMSRKSDGATVVESLFAAIAISGLVGIAAISVGLNMANALHLLIAVPFIIAGAGAWNRAFHGVA